MDKTAARAGVLQQAIHTHCNLPPQTVWPKDNYPTPPHEGCVDALQIFSSELGSQVLVSVVLIR